MTTRVQIVFVLLSAFCLSYAADLKDIPQPHHGDAAAVRLKEGSAYRWVVGEIDQATSDRVFIRTPDGARVSFPAEVVTRVRTVHAGTYAPAE